MAAISSLRSQRLSAMRPDSEQQYVAFRLRFAWFILPIESIYRLIPLEKHIPKLTLAGKTVPIVDIGKILFGQNNQQSKTFQPLIVNGESVSAQPSLIVARGQNDQLVGLLSNSQPALQKISQNEIVPLPPTYTQQWKVNFVTAMTLPANDRPCLFLINCDRLAIAVFKNSK